MTDQITPIEKIGQHARLSLEIGLGIESCPFAEGTKDRKRWIAAFLVAEVDREDQRQVITTFAGGACEQLEEVRA